MLSERRASRQAELVEAAVRAIRELGPSVSMEEMARVAGITKPILYRHFGDKAGLCQAIAGQKAEQLWQAIGPLLDPSTPGGEPDLEAALEAYLAFCEREDPVHRFLLAQHGQAGRHLAVPPDDFGSRIATLIAEGFRRRLIESGGDPAAAEPWAYGVVGMVTESAAWWLITRRMSRSELRDHLLALIWNGLGQMTGAATESCRRNR
jgi:AcrR family transcriptional regulator